MLYCLVYEYIPLQAEIFTGAAGPSARGARCRHCMHCCSIEAVFAELRHRPAPSWHPSTPLWVGSGISGTSSRWWNISGIPLDKSESSLAASEAFQAHSRGMLQTVEASIFLQEESPVTIQSGGWRDWEQPCQEGLGVTGGWKVGRDLTMCAGSPEGQPCPGLHPQQHGQQVEGQDSGPLLRSGETPPGVLCTALDPSAQERRGPVGAGPEKGHKNNPRAGTPFLWGKAERAGAVQARQEKASGRPYYCLAVLKRGL